MGRRESWARAILEHQREKVCDWIDRWVLHFLAHGVLLTVSMVLLVPRDGSAQGETTSAIVGQVTDSSDAVVPAAVVTVTSRDTGFRRTVKTDQAGRFNFPQLQPGTYSVRVEAPGFESQQNDTVSAALGQKQTVGFVLKVAQANQTVEVTEGAPLLNTANANTSTTLNAPALENLPNPGGDLTYPLQFAAGALINTAGSGNDFVGGTNGYGNVEFNGLARAGQRLHRGWAGDQRSAHQPQQRPLDEPGPRAELDIGSDGQHALLFGGSGPLRSRPRSTT